MKNEEYKEALQDLRNYTADLEKNFAEAIDIIYYETDHDLLSTHLQWETLVPELREKFKQENWRWNSGTLKWEDLSFVEKYVILKLYLKGAKPEGEK
jgi:hypothetical protein